MKSYVVTAVIEVEAEDETEAEDLIVDMFDAGFYVEIKEVKELG